MSIKVTKIQNSQNSQPFPLVPGEQALPSSPPPSNTLEDRAPDKLENGLTTEEHLCAVMEGSNRFRTGQDLIDYLGRSWTWFIRLRSRPEYRAVVQETVKKVAEQIVGQATSVKDLFNNEIPRNVATMIEIRDNPTESGKTRLAAAVALTDRAPDVPRAKEPVQANIILQLPIQHMATIQKALIEDKRGDIVDLIKGEGYEDVDRGSEGEEFESSPGEGSFKIVEVE